MFRRLLGIRRCRTLKACSSKLAKHVFLFLKNPTYFDVVLMEASFDIIVSDVPRNICEFWPDPWLVGDDSVGEDICSTSHNLMFWASQM